MKSIIEPVIRPHGGKYFSPPKMERTYDHAQLKEWQGKDLDFKIAWAKRCIMKALGKLKNPSVAFSAGKDSTVLLHLIREFKPDINVIYGNTTIEFPECIHFAHSLRDNWNLNYFEAVPEVSFWWVVKNYGWPLMGKNFGVGGVAHKESRKLFFGQLKKEGKLTGNYAIQAEVPIGSACCVFLKERPSQKLQKKLGVDGVFLGILASESRRRMFNFLQYGELYYPKSQNIWKCHPLAIWTDEDIWAYIRRFNVPYAKLYDMGYFNEDGRWIAHKRNGCMWCGMDLRYPDNHLSIMRRTHPKAWRTVMVKMGLGKVLHDLHLAIYKQYDMFQEIMGLKEYLEKFPCAFDRI